MNKLVRDNFLKNAKKQKNDNDVTSIREEELLPALLEKLEREHEELRLSMKMDQVVEMIEVLYTVAGRLGVKEKELLKLIEDKRKEEGGYTQGIVIVSNSEGLEESSSQRGTGPQNSVGQDRLTIKSSIIEALQHPEAEDGLYFRNFYHLHEEDERGIVPGSEEEILEALKELMEEGEVIADETGKEVVFFANGLRG